VNASGEVLFVGETTSTDLPVSTDAHQAALATGPDAVLADDCTAVLVGAADGPGFPVVDL
jgi:hypothetical protein